MACAVGHYAGEPRSPSCKACPRGRSQKTSGASSCITCATGTYAQQPAQHTCDDFLVCPIGEELQGYNVTQSGTCVPCADGSFKPTGIEGVFRDQCVKHSGCPAGKYRFGHSSSSMGSCVPCARHQYRVGGVDEGYAAVCRNHKPCPAGQFRAGHSLLRLGGAYCAMPAPSRLQ